MSESNIKNHNLILKNREHISLSGVVDVYGFNEESISANTQLGGLVIKGSKLHISKLDLEVGDIEIEGYVNSLQYLNNKNSKPFLQRIFN